VFVMLFGAVQNTALAEGMPAQDVPAAISPTKQVVDWNVNLTLHIPAPPPPRNAGIAVLSTLGVEGSGHHIKPQGLVWGHRFLMGYEPDRLPWKAVLDIGLKMRLHDFKGGYVQSNTAMERFDFRLGRVWKLNPAAHFYGQELMVSGGVSLSPEMVNALSRVQLSIGATFMGAIAGSDWGNVAASAHLVVADAKGTLFPEAEANATWVLFRIEAPENRKAYLGPNLGVGFRHSILSDKRECWGFLWTLGIGAGGNF